MEGLDWQTVQIPFGFGTEQKTDRRALNAPELVSAKDITFSEFGGLQTRKPLAALGLVVDGNSTQFDTDDLRRVERFGGELLMFTKDRLYSRRGQSSQWTEKGTHLAVATTETPRFVTTGDQIQCDRAELAGVTIYSWHEVRAGSNWYGFIAAVDTATGNVILPPYELAGFKHIRLVALGTKVLLVYYDGITGHYCYALDPADPAAAFSGPATTVHTGGNEFYDAVKVPGADQAAIVCRKTPTTSYQVVTMTAALVRNQATKARTSIGPMAVAVTPDGLQLQVVRSTGVAIKGDLITLATLADVWTDQAIGVLTVSNFQIAAEFKSVAGVGGYTCHVFWDHGGVNTNTVTTANVVGAESLMVCSTAPVSRAFAHDGRVYVWLSFDVASTFSSNADFHSYSLQSTYFLYRDDGFLCAKAVAAKAGGETPGGRWLPAVQALGGDTYAWAGIRRRLVRVGGSGQRRQAYGARSPQDIVFTFDSNEARRCVRLGGTLYIAGGEVLQYDGVQLTEVGFHVYPFEINLTPAAGGDVEDGTYGMKQTARWDNAAGEIDRSTSATVGAVTVSGGGAQKLQIGWTHIPVTHKVDRPIAIETWRTLKNPEEDDPFYLVSDLDPGNATNPNRYLENDTATADGALFEDALADADLKDLSTEAQAVIGLEPLAPPAATIIAANADRIFLAGVAGDPDRIWYSRLRGDGEVAAFHETLTVPVPRDGGDITAIAFLAETLIVFRERAIYMLPGDGYDNGAGGTNYGPARIISLDVGAESAEAVAIEPRGIVFHGLKGKYLLDHGGGVQYIGAGVASYDDEEVLAVHVLESEHQIRWVTSERVLVLDYLAKNEATPFGQWGEWTVATARHAAIWDGTYVVLTDGACLQQRTDFTGIAYGLDVETSWFKMNDLQGAGRVRRIEILGEWRGSHWLQVQLFRDYETEPFQTVNWKPDNTVVGTALQVKIGPSIQRCEALKFRIRATDFTVPDEETPDVVEIPPSTEALKLTGLALELGLKRGLNKRLSAAQRT